MSSVAFSLKPVKLELNQSINDIFSGLHKVTNNNSIDDNNSKNDNKKNI